MGEKVSVVIYVEGIVQGVGYRNYVDDWSQKLKLCGYCQNLSDGRVLVEAEGNKEVIELLIQQLWQGPRSAKVTAVKITWGEYEGKFSEFSIHY